MDPDFKEYVDKKDINKSPNWICTYCNSQNKASDDTCNQCGASRTESTENYFTAKREPETPTQDKSDPIPPDTHKPPEPLPRSEPDLTEHKEEPESFLSKIRSKLANSKIETQLIKKIGISLAISITILAALFWLFTPVERTAEITGFEWYRNITIEENREFQESDWYLPSGAELRYTRTEIRSYKQVFDHYKTVTKQVPRERITGYRDVVTGYRDLGNGQFEEITSQEPIRETYYETVTEQEPVYRDEPVYDTKYYYNIWRWVDARNVKTSGFDKNPEWGTYTLGDLEREGRRSQTYYIVGNTDGNSQRFTVSRSEWDSLNVGDVITFETFRFGNKILKFKGIDPINISELQNAA